MAKKHPLQVYRETHKLSKAGLALRLEVDRSTIHRWESGLRKIDDAKISHVSKKTGIPARQLRPDLHQMFGEAS